ncbi:hypothetical protein K439DRAFT_1629184 [Ramaria rubella]|nr:hypothetical protein K439DRAFT_1629184 [Ramaria rubella]
MTLNSTSNHNSQLSPIHSFQVDYFNSTVTPLSSFRRMCDAGVSTPDDAFVLDMYNKARSFYTQTIPPLESPSCSHYPQRCHCSAPAALAEHCRTAVLRELRICVRWDSHHPPADHIWRHISRYHLLQCRVCCQCRPCQPVY